MGHRGHRSLAGRDAEGLPVEFPVVITQGRKNPFGLVADSGYDRPAMRNAENLKVPVEVLVVPESLVLLTDDHADKRFLRDLLGVTLGKLPRTDLEENGLISPIGALQQIFRLDATCSRSAFEFRLQGSCADDRNRPEIQQNLLVNRL